MLARPLGTVAKLKRWLKGHPRWTGALLAGSAFHGSGVDAAVRSGEAAAAAATRRVLTS